jgi:single-strand DNA-binding protein
MGREDIRMNHVTLMARLTKDPEIRYSQGNEPTAYGSYTLAVDRPVGRGRDAITDFINCKVVGKPAEFAEKYLRKGMKIAIEGRIQVDNYKDKDGNNRSTTYVQVSSHEFCESRQSNEAAPAPERRATSDDGFMNIPDCIDEELPFV